MTTGDWIAVSGDAAVVIGLLLTLVVFLLQRASSAKLLRQLALAILGAAKDGIAPWGPLHFGTDYSIWGEERVQLDFDAVMNHDYMQNFCAPTQPLISVINQPDEGRYIARQTIEAINIALWKIGQFNQIVQQQTDFNAQHAVDIRGDDIATRQRHTIAEAAKRISVHIHMVVIGDGRWYEALMQALDENIEALHALGKCRWWTLRWRSLPGYAD